MFRAGRRQPDGLLAQRVLNNIKIRRSSRKYTLRGFARINGVAVVLLFVGQCQFARTVVPRSNVSTALTR